MKLDRLIGILSILLQQEKVTAPYLADKFEVSRRTINRDIEDLCKAGIPIVTTQGVGGGISIMEGYAIERTLLTSADMQAVLAGLRSLDSVSGTNRYGQLMEKLSAGASDVIAGDQYMLIDLASWRKMDLAPKIELIHGAIGRRERIAFSYYAPKGESKRRIEPYYLLFQWSSWYVWGMCLEKKDFRMFKLARMENLRLCGETFERQQGVLPDLSTEHIFPEKLRAKAVFKPECKWRLLEEYGRASFTEQEDGMLLFSVGFTDSQNLIEWMLTFGDKVELLEPKEAREELLQVLKAMQEKYEENTNAIYMD